MSFLVPPRRPSHEHLDDPHLPPDEMRRSLEDLRMVNRRWGGSRALERHLLPRVQALGPGRARILDVGAGSGEMAFRLEKSLRSAGCDASVLALDLQWRHLMAGRSMARGESARAAAADAFRLPIGDNAVDFVVSSLFFHHFSPEENGCLLQEFSRVARRGFAVLDLRRHRLPEIFVALAGSAVFKARISVEDGIASVRQAYTPDEALRVARRVAPGSRARRVFPFRLLLTAGS